MGFKFYLSKITVIGLIASIALSSNAQAGSAHDSPEKLSFFQIFTEVPQTFAGAFHIGTSHDSAAKWALALGLTVPLLIYDEDIYVATPKMGHRWGLSNDDELRPYGRVHGDLVLMWGPSDLSSALYFLGDGWIHLGLAGGMLVAGAIGDHVRTFNTAIELFNGFLSSTIFEQAFKYAAGREDPGVRTAPGGAWHPFPGWSKYQSERTLHDAFPSGHVMTTTVTFTVLRENYPEWNAWLWPTQIVYTSLLGFGMVNNGIHWAGDYPIGIMLGYLFGKSASQIVHRRADTAQKPTALLDPVVTPAFDELTGEPVAMFNWKF